VNLLDIVYFVQPKAPTKYYEIKHPFKPEATRPRTSGAVFFLFALHWVSADYYN
jgi:hypothetical protein